VTAEVGFIGLGAMGVGMAHNLQKQGLLSAVWNRTAAKAEQFGRESSVRVARDLAELASLSNVIVSCVSADADVLGIVDTLLPHLSGNHIVIDCSTISSDTARTAAHRLRARQVPFLDAPVSGGVEGARNATLAIMVGGDETAFDRAQPVLRAMGKVVTHFGASGY
jgi:3-hydroxyisobutyrate dehydrogenase